MHGPPPSLKPATAELQTIFCPLNFWCQSAGADSLSGVTVNRVWRWCTVDWMDRWIFAELWAPKSAGHLVPSYSRASRHLHGWYLQNSATHTKTIKPLIPFTFLSFLAYHCCSLLCSFLTQSWGCRWPPPHLSGCYGSCTGACWDSSSGCFPPCCRLAPCRIAAAGTAPSAAGTVKDGEVGED